MLKDKMKPEIRNKIKGLLLKTDLLHHDNPRPHIMVTIIQTIRNLKFEVMPHPSCSPNLASCDFHASGPLSEALCGLQFGCD
jgi:hypothetical protein